MKYYQSKFRRFWKKYICPFNAQQVILIVGVTGLLGAVCIGFLRLLYGQVMISSLILKIAAAGALIATLILIQKKWLSAQYQEQSLELKICHLFGSFIVFAIILASILGYADIYLGQRRALKPCQRVIEQVSCGFGRRGPSTCRIRVLDLAGGEGVSRLSFSENLNSWLQEGAWVELSFAHYPLGTRQLEGVAFAAPDLSKKNIPLHSCFEAESTPN